MGVLANRTPQLLAGAALPSGKGWYRKQFAISAGSKGKYIAIDFDGVYRNSEVWINGHYLGKRPNGYISFRYELSPFLHYGGKNTIAVKVDNSKQPNSRWYSGSGIYRDVKLLVFNAVHVDHWATFILTPVVNESLAKVKLKVSVSSPGLKPLVVMVKNEVYDQDKKLVSTTEKELKLNAKTTVMQDERNKD